MDAMLTENAFSYDGPPPLLIAGSSEAALRLASGTAAMAGLRSAGRSGISDALLRLRRQVAASGIWIELDEDGGTELGALLDEAEAIASRRPFAAVVSIKAQLIDSLGPRLFKGNTQWLIDAGPVERVASLATATALANAPARANDVSRDPGAERLRQLSDEVSRIATTLARLSAVAPAAEVELRKPVEGGVPDVSVETVRSVIRARRMRSRFFAEDLFADPAWDMLLDLLQAEIAQLRVPVSSLCIAAAVPATTALRWLRNMTDKGLFVRRADPHDGRRVFVELSREASVAMRCYFAEIGKAAVV